MATRALSAGPTASFELQSATAAHPGGRPILAHLHTCRHAGKRSRIGDARTVMVEAALDTLLVEAAAVGRRGSSVARNPADQAAARCFQGRAFLYIYLSIYFGQGFGLLV